MSLENTSTELNDLIGHTLYEECYFYGHTYPSIENAWYIKKIIGEDDDGHLVVWDDENERRILGVTSFLTPEECFESLSEENKQHVDKWWLK